MTGDIQDFISRLRAVLPARWFPDEAPVLNTLLTGLAWCWSWLFDCVTYVRAQARISTAAGVWLDAIAMDYFAPGTCQRRGQNDDDYRRRIQADLLREHGNRRALRSVLKDLTGRTPLIFEPANPTDTGGYGSMDLGASGLAYCTIGGWGSLTLPFQSFVTAYRPSGAGIALVCGYGGSNGSYGGGSIEYASLDMIAGRVTDDDIHNAISGVIPAAMICWTHISS